MDKLAPTPIGLARSGGAGELAIAAWASGSMAPVATATKHSRRVTGSHEDAEALSASLGGTSE